MFRVLTPIIRSWYSCKHSFWYWLTGSTAIRLSCWVLIRQREWMVLDPVNQYFIAYLLTYSKGQNPSWEANWFAASQEILRISRNPKVHYRTHKRPPPVSVLDQPNPVHIPISHLLEIHPNIIQPSTPRSPHWSPSLRFPQQDPIHPPLLTHSATCPVHLIG